LPELLAQSAKGPLKNVALNVGQNTFRHLQLKMTALYILVLLNIIPYRYIYNIPLSLEYLLRFSIKDSP
jgi:hypothetical protein